MSSEHYLSAWVLWPLALQVTATLLGLALWAWAGWACDWIWRWSRRRKENETWKEQQRYSQQVKSQPQLQDLQPASIASRERPTPQSGRGGKKSTSASDT